MVPWIAWLQKDTINKTEQWVYSWVVQVQWVDDNDKRIICPMRVHPDLPWDISRRDSKAAQRAVASIFLFVCAGMQRVIPNSTVDRITVIHGPVMVLSNYLYWPLDTSEGHLPQDAPLYCAPVLNTIASFDQNWDSFWVSQYPISLNDWKLPEHELLKYKISTKKRWVHH